MKKSPLKSNKISPRPSLRNNAPPSPAPSSLFAKSRIRAASAVSATSGISHPNSAHTRKYDHRRPSAMPSIHSLGNLTGDPARKLTGRKLDERKDKGKCAAVKYFIHDFTALLFSPLFLRHRNIVYFLLEIIIPAFVAMIIFAAFTSGVSWQNAQLNKKDAKSRNLNFPEISMDETTTGFRTLHADAQNHILIYYTPADNLTAKIMNAALDILHLHDSNIVFRHGRGSSGVVGVKSSMELYERAMYHRNDHLSHGEPVGVIFRYDSNETSEVTNFPYSINYTISVFDESIANTDDANPPIEAAMNENWKTPYLTSGFLGLQYAIDEAIIRSIIEKQKEAEIEEIGRVAAADARALLENEDPLTSEDIDLDMLSFLIAETLEEIRQEKEKREEFDLVGEPNDSPDLPDIIGLGRSLDTRIDKLTPRTHNRPIRTVSEVPKRSLRAFRNAHVASFEFRDLLSYVVTFSLVVAYSFMSYFIVRQIAAENISGIKELLQIHGLPNYMHWAMLFVHALVFRTITSALIVLTLKIDYGNGKIVSLAETDILFLLIYIHQISLTFMNYFIASYVQTIRMCSVIAVSCCVLSFYLPETFAGMKLIGNAVNFIVGIVFPNWCFRHAMHCLLDHEADEKSVNWDNIMEKEYASNDVTVGDGMIRLAFVGLGYFFLAVYVGMSGSSRIFPTTEKWHSIRDWIKKKRSTLVNAKDLLHKRDKEEDDDDFHKPQVYEDPHPDKECYVYVRNLCKNYGHHKVALDGLSINIMHEEVTVFLGHSGCGKTTLISILAGILQPSNGHATVNGFDVSTQTAKAREFIGICPQTLVAFNLLTVREHVHLLYQLRGYNNKDCNLHTASVLTQLKLWNVRSSLPSTLTNDEVRRLGIAMSMVDAPKILMLDEPTRGMDAMGRREVWDIILSMRQNHTIIVTTNYMDEAEHLADRLALLAHGRLVCCGSLDYLKSQYDTGYFLKLMPFPNTFLDANAVTNFVRKNLGPKVQMKRHKRLKDVDTLELELPSKEKNHFADFCDELDKMKIALHIMKYSIRQVTLSDIFIKICSSVAADGYAVDLYVRRDSAGDIKTVLTSEIPEIPEGTEKNVTRVHHFLTLLKRSWTMGKVAKRAVLLHFGVPLMIIWIVVFQAKLFVQSQSEHGDVHMTQTRFGPNLRIFAQIKDDDPIINYTGHIHRVLSPYEVPVDKNERIITKLYETLNSNAGSVGYAKDRHVIAYELGKKGRDYEFTGYFATGTLHSAPIALNLMNNVILSVLSEGERGGHIHDHPYRVSVTNAPMPQVKDSQFEKDCGIPCILMALLMSLALAFISHSCCVLPLAERENGMKHLILMCRVEPSDYWIANFVVDIVLMSTISLIIVLIFLSDLNQTFLSTEVIVAIWIICFVYLCWGGLMYCYYICSIAPRTMNGYNFLAVLHLFLGIVPLLWFAIAQPESDFGIFCEYVLLVLLPPYAITSALLHFLSNSGRRNICRNINSIIAYNCNPNINANEDGGNSVDAWKDNLEKNYPKLVQCCERICKSDVNRTDTCFHPPKVFDVKAESWGDSGLVMDVFALFVQGFIFWGFLILSERKFFKRLGHKLASKITNPRNRKLSIESDNISEYVRKSGEIRVESLAVESIIKGDAWPEDLAMVCHNLTKSTSSTIIIKDFSLEVKRGQCVAILGRSNTGKSSIVKMITGDVMPTLGNVYIRDANLLLNRKEYLSHLGYCPEKGCTFQDFTGSQMIELMGRLRGIPSSILSTHVNKWLNVMGLAEVANDTCKEYGVGMKQRLCTAMALIGEPEIIILDEPTTGVDPSARERLWCVMEHLTQMGFTIIFTTYSTDEAFTLADKVVVIAEGGIQCIGAPEDVREKYAKGHTLTFKLKHDVMSSPEIMSLTEVRVTEFKEHAHEIYRHLDLLDEHDEMLMFFVRDSRLSWAEVFRRGHYLATVHDDIIESYEVTEGGVDDIFVFLTNKYHELAKPRAVDLPAVVSKAKATDELDELKKAGEAHRWSQY